MREQASIDDAHKSHAKGQRKLNNKGRSRGGKFDLKGKTRKGKERLDGEGEWEKGVRFEVCLIVAQGHFPFCIVESKCLLP